MTYAIIHAELPPVAGHFYRASVARSHAYLALAREDVHSKSGFMSEDEIHFKTNEFYRYDKTFPINTAPDFKETLIRPVLLGDENTVKQIWAQAVEFAKMIGQSQIPFDSRDIPEAYNCRAGLMVVLKHVGLEFNPPERANDISGTQTNLWAHLQSRLG